MTTATVSIRTESGISKRTRFTFAPHSKRRIAIVYLPEHDEWTLTHIATGYAMAYFSSKRKAADAWKRFRAQLKTQYTETERESALNETDPRTAGRLLARAAKYSLRSELSIPDDTFRPVRVKVRNRITREVRIVTLTADDLINGDSCTGPCECGPIDPDAWCADGWPARQQAIHVGVPVESD